MSLIESCRRSEQTITTPPPIKIDKDVVPRYEVEEVLACL